MLYYLFSYLQQIDVSGARLFSYITFRAGLAFVLALVVSVWFGNWFIKLLKRKHVSETQRDEHLDPFGRDKKDVPTMGGVVIIAAMLLAVLLVGRLDNIYLLLVVITTVLLGVVGFIDDYIKTFKHNKNGLHGWWKIAAQVMLGLIVGLTLRYSPTVVMNETVEMHIKNNKEVVYKSADVKSTQTTIPFVKHHNLRYSDFFSFLDEPYRSRAGWGLFVLMTVLVVAAVSNGTNLNDGLDGMAAGNSTVICMAIMLLAYISGNVIWADYFKVMYIPGSEELMVVLAALTGALIGFLWYNIYPAQIFMGDTGSLTLGGIIAVSAVIIHKELMLPLICGVFLMESLSVILQTRYYKYYKKRGLRKRIWVSSPFHDHFRKSINEVLAYDPLCTFVFKGPQTLHFETKVTMRFWIVTILLVAFAIISLKIR